MSALPEEYEQALAGFVILSGEMAAAMATTPLAPERDDGGLESAFLISLKGLLTHVAVAQFWFEKWRASKG